MQVHRYHISGFKENVNHDVYPLAYGNANWERWLAEPPVLTSRDLYLPTIGRTMYMCHVSVASRQRYVADASKSPSEMTPSATGSSDIGDYRHGQQVKGQQFSKNLSTRRPQSTTLCDVTNLMLFGLLTPLVFDQLQHNIHTMRSLSNVAATRARSILLKQQRHS